MRVGVDSRGAQKRGQSHLVGAVVLFVVVLVGAGAIAAMGTSALSEHRQEMTFDAATMAMEDAGSSIDGVATGTGGTSTVSIGAIAGRDTTVDPDAGSVRVTVTAGNGTVVSDESVDVGAIEYEQDGRIIAYQSGGVYAAQDGGSTVLARPPMEYLNGSDATLTLPVITVKGTTRDGTVRVSQTSSRSLVEGVTMPLPADYTVTLSVTSEYYQAWSQSFNASVSADAVDVDRDSNTTTVTLNRQTTVTETHTSNDESLPGAVYSEGGRGLFTNHAYLDGYDSSTGPYSAASATATGDVRLAEATEFSSNATIAGDLHVGTMTGPKTFTNHVTVEGNTAIGDGSGDPVTIEGGGGGPGQTFGGIFSTKDEIDVARHATFQNDVIVGGNLVGFRGETNSGSMYVHGDATLEDDTVIDGDLIVGGDLDIAWGTVTVNGDVIYAGTRTGSGTLDASGTVQQDASTANARLSSNEPLDPNVSDVDSVGDIITEKGEAFWNGNGNDEETGVRSNNRTNCYGPTSSCSIGPGSYYFQEIKPDSDDTLTFNTNGGDVVAYVDEGVTLVDGVDVEITGDNQVILLVGTSGATDVALEVTGSGDGAEVIIDDDDASQFWVYARPNASADINSNGRFNGVLYGPGGNGHSGVDLRVTNDGKLTGAFVGNLSQVSMYGEIHADGDVGAPPIQDTWTTTTTTTEDSVRFLTVRAHEVTLED